MTKNLTARRVFACCLLSVLSLSVSAASRFVSFSSGDVLLNREPVVSIYVSSADLKGVSLAADNLASDLAAVTGTAGRLCEEQEAAIVVGTLGHSPLIDRFAKQGLIDGSQLRGCREKFLITTIGQQLVIAGSDRRGTIYGIYELSRQIGVSPWYYWADVPTEHHDSLYIKKGVYTDGEPAVDYRGIFLNDEAPCLTSWVKNTFHTNYGGHEFYAKVFELILRLRGNMLWPAMWSWAFYADDPENGKLADEMGIVVGTSHHEPMARNHQEWARHRSEYGAWNYQTNQAVIDRFFREGIERMRGTEDMVTIGMRGDGDEAMSEEADTRLLQRIVKNQRRIISQVTGRPARETQQVWALYKEVLDYYDKGMRVPDDVIMLLCDDNWGNVRRVPGLNKHKGGWGLYYHVDYVGAPRNSKWLNVTPSQNMWEQLSLAYDYGISRMWILNVGDLKPMEYPIQLFMDMAWNPRAVTVDVVGSHTEPFCTAAFGPEEGPEAARLLNLCSKMNGRVTAEMLTADTYNLHSGEWAQVVADYVQLEAEALRQYVRLQPSQRDAYREMILFPIQAMGNVYAMYYAQAMNQYLARQGRPEANEWAARVAQCFRRDSLLCAAYNNEIAGGKWHGMMTQKHIGYRSWNDDFPRDILPRTVAVASAPAGGYSFTHSAGYVSMEAEHYYSAQAPEGSQWSIYPDYGRTLSAVALTPYTQPVGNAQLSYRFTLPADAPAKVKVRVEVKSTLDFLNVGGHEFAVSLDGSEPQVVNMNKTLVDRQPYMYSEFYPTIARRIIEKEVELPVAGGQSTHVLTLQPHHPGIVFEKIVVDFGGYRPSYLFMDESPCSRAQ